MQRWREATEGRGNVSTNCMLPESGRPQTGWKGQEIDCHEGMGMRASTDVYIAVKAKCKNCANETSTAGRHGGDLLSVT